jgi:murein DD-endopeptidase MepM/ murein hydrolase activator NlpD
MIDWPLDENIIRRGVLNNTFGLVRRDRFGRTKPHQGWDLRAKIGTPCYAIADGEVALVYHSEDYGKVLVLEFFKGRRLYAAYCHLSLVMVESGNKVTLGQAVALTGDSGNARGMSEPDQHLHFEIRTVPRPGLGLDGRISPLRVFGKIPLKEPIRRKGCPT